MLALFGLCLAAVAACTDASPAESLPIDEVSSVSQDLTYCAGNCDCPFGQKCIAHQCQLDFGPFPPCYCPSRDCGPGYSTCYQGVCSNSCGSNCDCPYGSVCSGGTCHPDFGPYPPCYCPRRDCPSGYNACVNGYCSVSAVGGGADDDGPAEPDCDVE